MSKERITPISSFSGYQSGFGGVGTTLAEMWVNNAISVTRYDHRCSQLRFLVGTINVNVISCYAPQSGLSGQYKMTCRIKLLA